MRLVLALFPLAAALAADSSFLYRRVPDLPARPSGPVCSYDPLFGQGATDAVVPSGVARYSILNLAGAGTCKTEVYPEEEQIWVVLAGAGKVTYGNTSTAVKKDDFMYFAPGVPHGASNSDSAPLRIVMMGYRVPKDAKITAPATLPLANIGEVKKQVVGGHPPTTLYQLLIGTTASTRDRLAVATVVTSLFVMEFAPGGTNTPHRHKGEEEIYMLLDGHGDMVAGGAPDGTGGRHPATPGDAYYIPAGITVGFFNNDAAGEPKAHILAVRSTCPKE